jgi:hypothetical protein
VRRSLWGEHWRLVAPSLLPTLRLVIVLVRR